MSALFRKLEPDSSSQRFECVDKDIAHVADLDQYSVVIDVKACGLSYINSKVLGEVFCRRPSPQYPGSWEVAGEVRAVGAEVGAGLRPGDRVAGLLPLDAQTTAAATRCVLRESDVVKLSAGVSFEAAVACIGDGVRAYTALYYHGRVQAGDTLLLTATHPHWCTLAMQLAKAANAKVMVVVNTAQEKIYVENLKPPVDHIIEYVEQNNHLASHVSDETGGLGVDIVIDNGVRLFNTEDDCAKVGEELHSSLPTKHDIISCLGVGGRWVTSHPSLQLDPPNSEQLFLRCASVNFLFEHVWTLASGQQGKLQHILKSIVQRLAEGSLKPNVTRVVTLAEAVDALNQLEAPGRFGKTIVRID